MNAPTDIDLIHLHEQANAYSDAAASAVGTEAEGRARSSADEAWQMFHSAYVLWQDANPRKELACT